MTEKKIALVIGGAHPIGIGYASARSLAAQGHDVIVTGISEDEIALTPEHPRISTRVVDVRDDDAVQALFGGLDRLDALVNCAGTGSYQEFEIEHFLRVMDVNLNGAMRCCLAAKPLLARQGGAIVNTGSMYSIFGSKVAPAYAASKGGVMQLTKSLAAAWAQDGIRVNAVAPGWIKTNLARVLWEDPASADPIAERTPMGRWGEPEELGDVIGFLCSPAARFITGVMIPVDGGYSISG
jgi:NAD(P)-dependent dehydrogenase (short-subunit alcohol dehydrogenase family)